MEFIGFFPDSDCFMFSLSHGYSIFAFWKGKSVAPCNTNPAQAPSSVNKYGCGSFNPLLSALSLFFFQDIVLKNATQ